MKKGTALTNHLIATCHVIDNLVLFNQRLAAAMPEKNRNDFVNSLWKVSNGEFCLSLKARRFYEENKFVIDTINKYSDIHNFINENYDFDGVLSNTCLKRFINYLLRHKGDVLQVLAVLRRLQELGFNKIEFDESADFTQTTYQAYSTFERNNKVEFLDNLAAVPTYSSGVVEYKTSGSPYLMTLDMHYRRFSSSITFNTVVLNDFAFDPERLPAAITKEDIFDKIIGLRSAKQEEYTAVRESVDLNVGISDLYQMFNAVYAKLNGLTSVEQKDELIALLNSIHEAILKMQAISAEFDQTVVQNNPDISEEILEEEKSAYMRQREFSKIDLC